MQGKTVLIRLPVDAHRQAKIAAAVEGITLTEWLVRAIRAAATKQGAKPPK